MFALLEDDLLPSNANFTEMRLRLHHALSQLYPAALASPASSASPPSSSSTAEQIDLDAKSPHAEAMFLEYCFEDCQADRGPTVDTRGWRAHVSTRSLDSRGSARAARRPLCTAAVLYTQAGARLILRHLTPIVSLHSYDQVLPELIRNGVLKALIATPPLFYQDGFWGSDARGSDVRGSDVRGSSDARTLRSAGRRHHVLQPSCAWLVPTLAFAQEHFLLARRAADAEGTHLLFNASAFLLDSAIAAAEEAAVAVAGVQEREGDGAEAVWATVRQEWFMQDLLHSCNDEEGTVASFSVLVGVCEQTLARRRSRSSWIKHATDPSQRPSGPCDVGAGVLRVPQNSRCSTTSGTCLVRALAHVRLSSSPTSRASAGHHVSQARLAIAVLSDGEAGLVAEGGGEGGNVTTAL